MKTYFIYSPVQRAIKIGKSNVPEKRIGDMKTACPDLLLAGVLDGDQERQFHDRFKEFRIQREWFYCRGELRRFIRSQFNFRKLPHESDDRPIKVADSRFLLIEELCNRSNSAIICNATEDEFFDDCNELLSSEYPECHRKYFCDDDGCLSCEDSPYGGHELSEGDDCECDLCDYLGEFIGSMWTLQTVWDQVFGYSFNKDKGYFRLFVAFWLPNTEFRIRKMLDFCGELEWPINESDSLFAFDHVFIDHDQIVEADDIFYQLNPKWAAERDRWLAMSEAEKAAEYSKILETD